MRVNKYSVDEENTKFELKNLIRMLKFLKGYESKLILALFLSFISSILFLLIPKICNYVLDVTIPNNNFKQLIMLCIISLIVIVLSLVIRKKSYKVIVHIKRIVAYNMRNEMFSHLQYLPSTYFETRPHGKILTRLTSYADHVSHVICDRLLSAIIEMLSLVFVLIFMFTTNVGLTFMTLAFALVYFITFAILTPFRRKKQMLLNNKTSNVNAYMAESINGITITQSFNREKLNEEIYWDLETKRIESVKDMYKYWNSGWAIGESTATVVEICIYLFGVVVFSEATIGTIVAMASYSSQFWNPLRMINNIYVDLMDSLTYLERIFELLDEPLVIENSSSSKKINIKGNIEFKNVTFGYVKDQVVLDDISFKIKQNERIALVGETGSGKSTIVSLIGRYYDINQGEILIDNENIKDIDLFNLRKNINIMLQDNYVFARSILDNIKYANSLAPNKRVIDICKRLNIHDWIVSLKDGYNTILHNNGKEISTGQRQLICFARIMLSNPKILILDEATSNIDLKTEKLVQQGIDEVLKDRTSIVIAHRLSTISGCDRILFIKNKKIEEEGTHDELMAKKGDYYKLYQAQIGKIN